MALPPMNKAMPTMPSWPTTASSDEAPSRVIDISEITAVVGK